MMHRGKPFETRFARSGQARHWLREFVLHELFAVRFQKIAPIVDFRPKALWRPTPNSTGEQNFH